MNCLYSMSVRAEPGHFFVVNSEAEPRQATFLAELDSGRSVTEIGLSFVTTGFHKLGHTLALQIRA